MPERAQLPTALQGDLGIGVCLPCLGELITGKPGRPRWAITHAPMMWPPGVPDGIPVAVPACWEHVQGAAEAGTALRLVTVNGRLRGHR